MVIVCPLWMVQRLESLPGVTTHYSRYKLSFVANASWNIAHLRLPLMKALADQGFQVEAVAPEDDYSRIIKDAGFHFIPLRKLNRKGRNPVGDLRLLNELQHIYKNRQYNLCLHYTIKPNIYGTLAASKFPCQSLCTVTGLGYTFLTQGLSARIARKLYHSAFKRASRVLFQNAADRDLFVQ